MEADYLEGAQYGDIMTVKSLLPRPLTFIYTRSYIYIGDIMAKVRRICKQCGKSFSTYRSEIQRGSGKFCSRKCFEAWNVGEKNGNWQGGGVKLTCQNCGKMFRLAKNELNRQKGYFCARKCHFQFKSKNKMSRVQDRINRNMRRAVTKFIHEKKAGRKWPSLVGYGFDELAHHLEQDFRDGMSWENYGEWHIDHIIPISKFSFSSFEDEGFKKAWALNNLQPLWADENYKKGRRWRWY